MLKRLAHLCGKPPTAAAAAEPAPVVAAEPTPGLARLPPRLPASASGRLLSYQSYRSLQAATAATRQESERISKSTVTAGATPAAPQAPHWSRARQALAHKLADIANSDRMPPLQANLTYAQLVRGTTLLMEGQQDKAITTEEAGLLHALLLMGQHHNRWTAHNGLPSAQLIPLSYQSTGEFTGMAWSLAGGMGSEKIEISHISHGYSSFAVAHEHTHVGQFNGDTPRGESIFTPRQALTNADNHPREQMLETARGMPQHSAPTSLMSDKSRQFHALQAMEVQAHGEEAAAGMPLALQQISLNEPQFSSKFPVNKLLGLLLRAAGDLNEAQEAPEIACFDPAAHPKLGAQMERILFATAQLHDAMQSAAWTDAQEERVHLRMGSLEEKAADTSLQGIELLAEIANTLSGCVTGLRFGAGFALQTPATTQSEQAAPFPVAKNQPAKTLQVVLSSAGTRGLDGQPMALSAEQVAKAVEEAKVGSGFAAGVQAFQDSCGQLPEPQAVADTVTRLAARLIGLDMQTLPADLHPAVNLYEAPSTEFERIAGLNAPPAPGQGSPNEPFAPVTSHQKRKALFDPIAWQLHVPQHFFHPSQADRLAPRLAGLAADMAYTVSAVLAHNTSGGHRTPEALSAAGLWNARMPAHCTPAMVALGLDANWITALESSEKIPRSAAMALPIRKLLTEQEFLHSPAYALQSSVDQFLIAHPHSAAAVLHTIVKATPVKDLDLMWHLGPRGATKHAAQNGEPGAQAAYEASTQQRWQLPAVAFRRAVMQDSAPAAAHANGAHGE